jgi:hypothetical protein
VLGQPGPGRAARGTRDVAEVGQGAGDQPLTRPLAREGGSTAVWTMNTTPGSDRYSISPARVAPSQSSQRDARGLSATRGSVGIATTLMTLVSGYSPSGWPALAREFLRARRLSVRVRSGKRLAYCCSSWGMRLV